MMEKHNMLNNNGGSRYPNKTHDPAYAVEYIHQALHEDTPLIPPDKSRANGTYEVLEGLYEAHCRDQSLGAQRAFEMVIKHRPAIAHLFNPEPVPAVSAGEEHPPAPLDF